MDNYPNPVVVRNDNSVAATIIEEGSAQSQSQDPGFFARLELAIWVATHPGWLNHSVKPGLFFSGGASSCMTDDITEDPGCARLRSHHVDGGDGYLSPFYACQDYETLIPTLILSMVFAQALALDFATLAMVSRCGPFMAFDADIVDELLLCAASVHPIFGLPQFISAHNCDTETMLRLMSFLDPYIGSTKRSLLCSRKHCDSQSTLSPDGSANSQFTLNTDASPDDTALSPISFIGYKPRQRNTPASTLLCWLTQIQRTPTRGSVNGLFF
uniref:Uncharacterized protein n=1 Tax=Heterosigma akashiwo TaxID=2829 RepID=A0A7S3Y2W1_HETAK